MSKVDIIYETSENVDEPNRSLRNTIIAGKMAGICYMPDDYLSNGIQDSAKANTRGKGTAKSGHFSTYEHSHITFLIKTTKIVAMILNSTNLYSTSEKSGRYTYMESNSDLEKELYDKWINKFEEILEGRVYKGFKKETLARENARYMLSINTKTTLAFTVPYSRAILLISWMEDLSKWLLKDGNMLDAGQELLDLSKEFRKVLGFGEDEELPIKSHKAGEGIYLFEEYNYSKYKDVKYRKPVEYYGDVYLSTYVASYAALAQLHRHRPLRYTMTPCDEGCYIPEFIVRGAVESNDRTVMNEWLDDLALLNKSGIVPQGNLVYVTETGRFEDWYLKAQERLCYRAQLEACKITQSQVFKFSVYGQNHPNSLNPINDKRLYDMFIHGMICPRCNFDGFECLEKCSMYKTNTIIHRNV